MKLLVFGATGGTGREVVNQALQMGHKVTAVVRTPTALDVHHQRLEIIQGDVFDPSIIQQSMSGKDAVVSTLGVSHRNPTTVYSEGTANIIHAMISGRVRRLVCLSSAGLELPTDTPLMIRLVVRFIIQRMYRNVYADMARMEAIVRDSTIDWTIVRPPRLTDKPKTGKYRLAFADHLSKAEGISRADLAHFIVNHLADSACFRSRVEISY